MPRACTVCAHPKRVAINAELLAARPIGNVAANFRIGESSVRRHVRAHLSQSVLRELRVSEQLGSSDLLERLVEALDDVSSVRSVALLSGQASTLLRAASATESLVRTLMDRLGIDDLEIVRQLRDSETFARAVGTVIREHERGQEMGEALAARLDRAAPDLAETVRIEVSRKSNVGIST